MYEGFSPGVSKIWGSAIPEKIDPPIWMLPMVSPGVCDFRALILWGSGGSGRISRGGVGDETKTHFSLILQLKTVPGPRWRALGRGWGW